MKNILTYILESSNTQKIYSNMILLTPNKDKVLILRRANYMKQFRSKWGFPGGSFDEKKDKDTKEAAIRELKEETGIELSWKEMNDCKKYDSIKNENGSISDYYITTLENEHNNVKLSREHSKFEWYNGDNKDFHNFMPDIFQIIQKVLS